MTVPIAAAFGAAIKAASDLGESVNKTRVVFGNSAKSVEDWSQTAARSFGLSRQQALEAAGSFGTLFDSMGLAEAESAAMSQRLVGLAADLASFNNIDPTEALDKLRSGLVGETEPLRTVGVLLNEAGVQAKAMELGLGGASGQLTEAEKVTARYHLILEQTTTSQGDFARTADSLANQMRVARAELSDAAAALGEALLPAASKAAALVGDLARAFGSLPTPVRDAAVGFGLLLAAVGPVTWAAGALASSWGRLVGGAANVKSAAGSVVAGLALAREAQGSTAKNALMLAGLWGPGGALLAAGAALTGILWGINKAFEVQAAAHDTAAEGADKLAESWRKMGEGAEGSERDFAVAIQNMVRELRTLDAEAQRARLISIGIQLVTQEGMSPAEAIVAIEDLWERTAGRGKKLPIDISDLTTARGQVEALSGDMELVVANMGRSWRLLSTQAREDLSALGRANAEAFQSRDLDTMTQALQRHVIENERLRVAAEENRIGAAAHRLAVNQLNDEMLRATGISGLAVSGFTDLGQALSQIASAASGATPEQKAVAAAMLEVHNAGGPLQQVLDAGAQAMQRQKDAAQAQAQATETAADRQKRLEEETRKATEAAIAQQSEFRKAVDPVFRLHENIRQAAEAQADFNEKLRVHGERSPVTQEAARNWVKSVLDVREASLGAAGGQDEYNAMLADFAQIRAPGAAQAAGIAKQEVAGVNTELGRYVAFDPANVDVNAITRPAHDNLSNLNASMVAFIRDPKVVRVEAHTQAAQNSFMAWYNGLPKTVRVNVEASIRRDLGNITPEVRQHGGPVRARRPYLVGERAPEWFQPRVSGFVVNMRQAAEAVARLRVAGDRLGAARAGLAAAGQAMQVFNLTVTFAGPVYDRPGVRAEIDAAMDTLKRELRRRAR